MANAEESCVNDATEKPQFTHKPCSSKTNFSLDVDSKIKVPASINRYLRDYQRDGIQFLYDRYALNSGGILADDMGLGKTIQVIAFLSALLHKTGTQSDVWAKKSKFLQKLHFEDSQKAAALPKSEAIFLIIAPASVLFNWIEEFDTWAYFVIGKYHRSERNETLTKAKERKLDVVITTFETARDHIEELNTIRWDAVIVDECHKIKETKSRVTVALKSLKVKKRYGLTGTIMQNKMKEMWCLLDWANPGCLGSLAAFDQKYIQVIEKGQQHSAVKRAVAEARKIKEEFAVIRQKYILRRTKQLIKDQLPSKDDQVVYCRLSSLQESVYKSILDSMEFMEFLKPSTSRIKKTVEDIFDECQILHRHSNQRVVGASKVEDHISKCAINDVFELQQFSQAPAAAHCDPLLTVADEEEDVKNSTVDDIKKSRKISQKEPLNSSDPQKFLLPTATVVTGQTPILFRREHFQKLATHFSMTCKAFANHVKRLTIKERLELLEKFYVSSDRSLSQVFETLKSQPVGLAKKILETQKIERRQPTSSRKIKLKQTPARSRPIEEQETLEASRKTSGDRDVKIDSSDAAKKCEKIEGESFQSLAENATFSDLDLIFFGKTEKKKPAPKRKARDFLDELLF